MWHQVSTAKSHNVYIEHLPHVTKNTPPTYVASYYNKRNAHFQCPGYTPSALDKTSQNVVGLQRGMARITWWSRNLV